MDAKAAELRETWDRSVGLTVAKPREGRESAFPRKTCVPTIKEHAYDRQNSTGGGKRYSVTETYRARFFRQGKSHRTRKEERFGSYGRDRAAREGVPRRYGK